MDAQSIIEDWKRRLTKMANNPPYVFRDTPENLIKQYRRELTAFDGYTEREVANAEAELGVSFPTVFRTFLLELARRPGDLFGGSKLAEIEDFEEFRLFALKLMAQTERWLVLPREAVVFMTHQGYTFLYILGTGGFDGPVIQWVEGHREPRQVSDTFAKMVDSELRLMERNDESWRSQGGYYVTLGPDARIRTTVYPAYATGDRPLDNARKKQ